MRFAVAFLAFSLVACSNSAKDAVRDQLLDPDSAQFEGVSACPKQQGMYSGLVNSKNRSGAYAGAMAFFVEGRTVTYVDSYAFNDMIKKCFGDDGDGAQSMVLEWARYVDPSRPHSQSSDITK